MPPRQPQPARKKTDTLIGIDESELWSMADALRSSMDAAEYKHVVLELIFLKYISDAFEERHAAVLAEWGSEAAEDSDEYTAESIFWVPPEARWAHLKAQARQSAIGQLVDDAMAGVERDNPALRDILPRDYARPAMDRQRLGQLIDMIGNIAVGDEAARSNDVLGRVYEHFLGQFAGAEGRKGGEFYTPRCVVRLLVEMLEPYSGRVYDPCCGSSGMFVQSVEFIDARELGSMVDRTHRELTAEDIDRIADTYHRWRCVERDYEDEPGFCRSVPLEELRRHDHVLTPGRHVGAPPAEDDGEPFADKMQRLVAELRDQQAEGARLDAAISANLDSLGFGAPRE